MPRTPAQTAGLAYAYYVFRKGVTRVSDAKKGVVLTYEQWMDVNQALSYWIGNWELLLDKGPDMNAYYEQAIRKRLDQTKRTAEEIDFQVNHR